VTYGLDGPAEAEEYLRDPLLRSRLLTIATAVADRLRKGGDRSVERLMGSSIDAAKLVSSMTLFGHVGAQLHATEGLAEYASVSRVARAILDVAAAEGYPACPFTLSRLR
jgi:uncharacterized protein (DUF1810 family)